MVARGERTNALALALLLLIAAGLRLLDLGVRPLWFDEAMEYWVASAPLPQLLAAVRGGIQDPPLYSLLLHAWLPFTSDAFGLRLPSVLFSLGSVLGVALVAQRLGSREVRSQESGVRSPDVCSSLQLPVRRSAMLAGLVAGVILALLPTEIRYAQEAGQYALMGFTVTLNLLALQRLQARPDTLSCLFWVTSALLASYTFYGALLAVAAPLAVLLLDATVRRNWRRLLIIGGCGLAYTSGLLPLLLLFLPAQLSGGASPNAFRLTFTNPFVALIELGNDLSAALVFQLAGSPWTVVPLGVLWLALGLSALLVLTTVPRLDAQQRLWPAFLLAIYAANALTDLLNLLPLGFRYILISSPLLAVVIGQAAGTALEQNSKFRTQNSEDAPQGSVALLRTRTIAVLTLTLLLFVCLFSLPQRSVREILQPPGYLAWPETEDTQAMVQFWQQARAPHEPTYIASGALPAFAYYQGWDEQFNEALPPAWYTACWRAATPQFCTYDRVALGIWLGGRSTPQMLDDLRRVVDAETESFWVLAAHHHPPELDILLNLASEFYTMSQPYDGHNATAYYFERR
ncbi:hypothetical protein HC891_27275 [Candidatus Gracilibacteria bacterium]|nr:hypothetical protein [Candidatus Gracilibacteria bacterium]